MTAADVVRALEGLQDDRELATIRKRIAPGEPAIGIRMKHLFDTAKAHTSLALDQIEALLADERYEPRLAAFCILDFQVRGRLDDDDRRVRHDLYLAHHDRITTWDMVDRAAPRVVGGWLSGRGLGGLPELAASPDPLRRRTAMTAPLYFIRWGGRDDLPGVTAIAALLADDPEPVVHDAVGIALRHLGFRDRALLSGFLDEHGHRLAPKVARKAREGL